MASSSKRFMKLAGMTASITGKVAKNSLKQLSGNEDKRLEARSQMMKDIGIQIADTLGEMKGAVMKVGQIASQYREVFPPEVAHALEKLQKDAPPMPFELIKQQVEKELGQPIEELFVSFDEQSFASASIGQVHKAVIRHDDGSTQDVVVKVQYPNVAKNIDSDLSQIRLALKLVGVLNMSKELQEQIFNEIRDSLKVELDYEQEAKNLAEFAQFHAGELHANDIYANDLLTDSCTDKNHKGYQPKETGIIIPKVIASHSSKRILTLTQELGEPLSVASTWDNEVKVKLAKRLFHFSAGQLFRLQKLHCDPHPGNFAFRQDGSLIAYDFGGIRAFNDKEIGLFRQFMRHAILADVTALEQDLVQLGIRKEDKEIINGEFYQDWLNIGMKPLSLAPYHSGEFDFGNSDIHHKVIAQMKTSLKHLNQFQPSPTTMMVDRTVSGQYWNLVNLGVKVDLSELVKTYMETPTNEKD